MFVDTEVIGVGQENYVIVLQYIWVPYIADI